MKIEVGAGARARDGFLAVDLNPRTADVVADARRLPFADASVSAMRAVDVLEHISYRDTAPTLAEWARVCAPDAELYVQVPDADQIMRRYIEGRPLPVPDDLPKTGLAGATWRLLGGHADNDIVQSGEDFRLNAHYAFFSTDSLTNALDTAGFDVASIVTNAHPNICCQATRR